MSDTPTVPFGYRLVAGQLQKGDGLWDGKRFRKVRKDYPYIGTREGIAIRLCEVVQPVIPETVAAHEEEWVEP